MLAADAEDASSDFLIFIAFLAISGYSKTFIFFYIFFTPPPKKNQNQNQIPSLVFKTTVHIESSKPRAN
jgi:hypothetical protein